MRRSLMLGSAGLLVVMAGLFSFFASDTSANSITFKAMVVEVKDGDTLVVLRNKTRLTIQLPGIDAPELDQPFGPEAKRLMAKLVKGRIVTIETFRASNPMFAAVRFSRNRILAHEMVKAGLAWATTTDKFSMLGRAQEEAKSARLGLWANEDEDPVPPWEWRSRKRLR